MSVPEPNDGGRLPIGSPIVNETRLEATNSQIGNAAQLNGSPGAVVNQTIIRVRRIDAGVWAVLVLLILVAASKLTLNLGLPPFIAQVLAGFALAGVVVKFFEKVEEKLNGDTKRGITAWLLDRKQDDDTKVAIDAWLRDQKPLTLRPQNALETFTRIFDRLFGLRLMSWRALSISTIMTLSIICLTSPLLILNSGLGFKAWHLESMIPSQMLGNILPDFVSLLVMRRSLSKFLSGRRSLLRFAVGLVTFGIIVGIISGFLSVWVDGLLFSIPVESWPSNLPIKVDPQDHASLYYESELSSTAFCSSIIAALFTSMWLWLYAGSGFLIKFASRFNIGYRWFISHFDIEHKPLSAIGLVAGCVVALLWWTVVIVRMVV
jgi:hypothetical protein